MIGFISFRIGQSTIHGRLKKLTVHLTLQTFSSLFIYCIFLFLIFPFSSLLPILPLFFTFPLFLYWFYIYFITFYDFFHFLFSLLYFLLLPHFSPINSFTHFEFELPFLFCLSLKIFFIFHYQSQFILYFFFLI